MSRLKLSADVDRALVRELRDRLESLGMGSISMRSLVEDALREHALPRLQALAEMKQHQEGASLLRRLEAHQRKTTNNTTTITNMEHQA